MFWSLLSSSPPSSTSDFFSSSIWQFLSGIGAIIAIPIAIAATITAILAYRQQQRRTEITFQVISDAPIASINKAIENRVELLLDGEPVKDTRLLVLKIWNTGNVSVKSEDYFEPIKFRFAGATVLGSDILETKPDNLIDKNIIQTFLKKSPEYVELPNFPLNPGDSISLSILLTGKGELIESGRINQGKLLPFLNEEADVPRIIVYGVPIATLIIIISAILGFGNVTKSAFNITINIAAITLGVILSIYFFIKYRGKNN